MHNEKARIALKSLWGKLDKDEAGNVLDFLRLEDHCTDVAMVFRQMIELDSFRRVLERTAGMELTCAHRDRLAVIAFLHDLGKCNRGFQLKALPKPPVPVGHVQECWALIRDPALQQQFLEAIDFPTVSRWFDSAEGCLEVVLASVSHHGRPIQVDDTRVNSFCRFWRADEFRDPMSDLGGLMRRARELFPNAFRDDVRALTASSKFQHSLAGQIMLADWIGSHREAFFPYCHGSNDRAEFARNAARKALAVIGLDMELVRSSTGNNDFPGLFGVQAPYPLQQALFSVPESPLLIAESETGSGKTEAALGHFFRLFMAGEVDSLYFALPTRVAACELYQRVFQFARNAFPECTPPVLQAVPGYAQIDGEPRSALPAPLHLWQDENKVSVRERAWAAEMPKRFLAAPIAVGTIDQALLAAIRTHHAHLRKACLNRALLVVDEVHASDIYMQGILRALLQSHIQAGGRALLLSATLGSNARNRLLTPLSEVPPLTEFREACNQPYPAVTDTGRYTLGIASASNKPREVRIEPVAQMHDTVSLLPAIADALNRGARVLVILNTVARAMELFEAARADPHIAPALFSCNGVKCPHHGRYAKSDRKLLDAEVSAVLGRKSVNARCLLIGTQTLEQSLDIDADWLITDLAPMDVLLQRIGRLHRHSDRKNRPEGMEIPVCTLLVPEDASLEAFLQSHGGPKDRAGLGNVYPDLRIVRLTLDLLAEGTSIQIPKDNRYLIESTTHPERLSTLNSSVWSKHGQEIDGMYMAHEWSAREVLLPFAIPFGQKMPFGILEDGRLKTRLGLDSHNVTLPHAVPGPFGRPVQELVVPEWMVRHSGDFEARLLDSNGEGQIRFEYAKQAFCYDRLGLKMEVA